MTDAVLLVTSSIVVSFVLLIEGTSELKKRQGQLFNNPMAWFVPIVLFCLGARGLAESAYFLRHWEWATEVHNEILLEAFVPNLLLTMTAGAYLIVRILYVKSHAAGTLGAHGFTDQVAATKMAIETHDSILQELVKARWSLNMENEVEAARHINQAAIGTQALIERKLKESGMPRDKIFGGTSSQSGP